MMVSPEPDSNTDAPPLCGDCEHPCGPSGCECPPECPAARDEPYDRQREEHARDLLRSWADAANNAGCPSAFVARMRAFADMHARHASEAPFWGDC